MANIKYSKKQIEKYLNLNEKNIEKIAMYGTPLSISKDFLEIEVFPNRPDIIPMQNFIRAINAFTGKNPGIKKYKINKPEKNYLVKVSSSVSSIRPFTACAIVKGLSLDDEKIKEIVNWQEKLHLTLGRNRKKVAIGIYPLHKIKLPIKYEAMDPDKIKFIPLESEKEMLGEEILKKHPKGIEYAGLLENFNKFPVFTDAEKKVLSMPPIINSNDTGKITTDTEGVFIECSGFDFNLLNKTLNIIVSAFAEMGGKIYQMELDYEKAKKILTPDFSPAKIKISLEKANSLLGLKISEKKLQKLLAKMEYNYKAGTLLIPPWRTDILHEVDIIEDIAIAYGYENIEPQMPKLVGAGEENFESKIKTKIAEILIGLGFIEISSYHLMKKDLYKRKTEIIEVANSKTEYKVLRPNLIEPALEIFSNNKNNEYPQKIFEIGEVFSKSSGKTETGISESDSLLIAISPGNFTDVKQILDYLFKMLDIDYRIDESIHELMIEGRTGEIKIKNSKIGSLGELHPKTLRIKNMDMPVSAIEIYLEEIYNALTAKN